MVEPNEWLRLDALWQRLELLDGWQQDKEDLFERWRRRIEMNDSDS
jgi:hypothetical protein